jgi:hypothetical protein
MARSGTSLLAGMVHVLGVNLGQNLVRANPSNPEGYFENEDIHRLQKQILEGPAVYDVPTNSALPVPTKPAATPAFTRAKDQLVEFVRKELSQTSGLWGFKDSQTTRLLPIWTEVFKELNVEPVYLLALRNPLAVAASLAKVWETSPGLAQLMWVCHNVDVFTHTRRQPVRMVVDYDRWFTHPREHMAGLVAALGLPASAAHSPAASEALARVKPDLRHNRGDQFTCLPWVAETYALLQETAVSGKLSPRLRTIEKQVRAAREFIHYSVEGLQHPLVSKAAEERHAIIKKMEAVCKAREATITEMTGVCQQQANTIATMTRVCDERASTIATMTRVCEERWNTITAMDHVCKERWNTIAAMDRACREKDALIAQLKAVVLEQNAVCA